MNRTSISDTDGYRQVCLKAATDDAAYKVFKQDGEYRKILEHVNREEGELYLKAILNKNTVDLSKIDQFKRNDTEGNPIMETFQGPFGTISTTTLRYIHILSDLIALFGSLDGKSIVEIGGGYGGMCKILCGYFQIGEYHIYDLKEPVALQKRYLREVPHVFFHPVDDGIDSAESHDLLISTWALDELDMEVQQSYLKSVLSKSKHGYIIGYWKEANREGVPLRNKEELMAQIPNVQTRPEPLHTVEVLHW